MDPFKGVKRGRDSKVQMGIDVYPRGGPGVPPMNKDYATAGDIKSKADRSLTGGKVLWDGSHSLVGSSFTVAKKNPGNR